MSHAMTYSTLQDDIRVYCERSDNPFLSQIPRFINLAEQRLASEVHGLGYMKFVIGNLTATEGTLSKPARWRETVSLSIGVGTNNLQTKYLYNRSYEYCRTYWPNNSLVDEPEFYADYDYEHLKIVPTPDQNYPLELAYHEMPETLSDSNQTNWTTEYAPQLILYASLLETAPFLKNDERLTVWKGLYDAAKQSIESENARRWGDRSASAR